MHSKPVLCAIMAASLLTGPLAIAQGDSPGANRGRNEQGQRADERDRRGNDGRQWNRNQPRGNVYGHDRREGRGAGPDHSYYQGDRLPPQYRSRQYVVEDWRGHQLSAPPRGYHWVQSGGDYILVAIATGVILQLLLNN
jgi:Ni/Co efflux regulator RcnB